MHELLVVTAKECHPLRELILRPGQPPAAWTYELDEAPRAMHFAIKENGQVLGVASLLPEAREDGRECWRLRGMAVVPDARGRGLGRTLLGAVQAVTKQRGGGLWCTARTNVEGFYTHYEFEREGDVFEIEGAGPHVLMTWNPPERGRGVPASIRRTPAGAGDEEPEAAEAGDAGEAGEAGEAPDAEAAP
jgi:predicted GNAT family N-acyltransferase